jgi:hypothetical protein
MSFEVAETIDVSRGGVLLACPEIPLATASRAWIVFPFEASAVGQMEPETPARVVRVTREASGCRVGLKLCSHRTRRIAPQPERRRYSRSQVCLPVLVRSPNMPWPEEAMTLDFSRRGLRFETSQIYTAGENVRAKIPWGEWEDAGEISGRVLRVESGETASENGWSAAANVSSVAIEWIGNGTGSSGRANG